MKINLKIFHVNLFSAGFGACTVMTLLMLNADPILVLLNLAVMICNLGMSTLGMRK